MTSTTGKPRVPPPMRSFSLSDQATTPMTTRAMKTTFAMA